ncbi:MAG TPA: carbohydrate ABC transporter permease, partial [Rhizobium sp.]|nr:carbohydrate ABC transporter permease [Rhizobium sp.]
MADVGTLNTTVAGMDAVAPKLGQGPSGPRPRPALSSRNIVLYGTLTIAALYYLLPLY